MESQEIVKSEQMERSAEIAPSLKSREQMSEKCLRCGACLENCAFLRREGTPDDIARRCHEEARQEISFDCSLCGLCESVCPVDLSPRRMFLEMRREALTPEQLKRYRGLRTYETLGTSPLFTHYALPQGCDTVLFPGCSLPGNRPRTVLALYRRLRETMPALGIVLDCCGKPSHDLGDRERFERLFFPLRDALVNRGVKRVLVACPNCYEVFRNHAPSLEVRTIYEELGEAELSHACPGEITIHDPCVVRSSPDIHSSVRTLLARGGATIREMKHSGGKTLCCGEGGSVGFVDPGLAARWGEIRSEEAGSTPVISYCAGCVEKLSRHGETRHLLDLVLPSDGRAENSPSSSLGKYGNRLRLKQRLRTEAPQKDGNLRRGNRSRNPLPGRLFIAALLICAVMAVRHPAVQQMLDPQRVRESMEGFGALAPVLYILAYTLAPALFLPGLPLTLLGGILFGPFWGVVYTITGATAGATVAFLVARYLGRDWVSARLSDSKWQKLDREVEHNGWKVVAFTRLIPLFPFNLLNYAFGLTRVKLLHYVAATFACMLPACIAFIVFSSSLLDVLRGRISREFLVGIALIAAVSLLPLLYRRFRKVPE